jgi:hypothetical protein
LLKSLAYDDKRISNISAYSETRSRDLTVPSIGKERIFTVAKPELKVAVIISGIFSFIIYQILYARNTGKNTQNTDKNMIDNGNIQLPTKKLMYTVFYSN